MSQRWRTLSTVGLLALLAVNVAFGKIVVENFPALLPGVDEYGMLTSSLEGPGMVKLTTNTRTNRTVIVGRGKVTNLSGRCQVYYDIGASANGIPFQIISDVYCVARNGCAVYTGLAKNYSMNPT